MSPVAAHAVRPRRICVDMDEVMADAAAEHLIRYNRDFGEALTKQDLHGTSIWNIVAANRHPRLEEYLHSEDFFEVLDVMPDAQRVLRRLQQDYEIFIATAAMEVPTSFAAKYRWLGKHFPFIPASRIVFCGDKSILHADYLLDDSPNQLRRFPGEGILFHAYHNIATTGFRRVQDWLEVESLFLDELKKSS